VEAGRRNPDSGYPPSRLTPAPGHLAGRRTIYDERARLIGEHIYEDGTSREIAKLASEDVVTPEQARDALAPLIRPLPSLVGEVGTRS
jgi:hypothetical protein